MVQFIGNNYQMQPIDLVAPDILVFNSASAITVGMPAPNIAANRRIINVGVGTVTLAPSGGTINGKTTVPLYQGYGGTIAADGGNFYIIGVPAPWMVYP